MSEEQVETVVAAIKGSRKYRDTHEATIRALARQALAQHKRPKPAVKAVRKRLHSIMAPYLGDPDYEAAAMALSVAFEKERSAEEKSACWTILESHLSTRERLPIMVSFYEEIFEMTGVPRRLADVASGLNPLALPWMGLPDDVEYIAYDIHEPRVALINHYFCLRGMRPMARLQDVALNAPVDSADVALFLKEMPRFERNYPGQGRRLLHDLKATFIVISFPTVSTHGGRSLVARYREFLEQLLAGTDWPARELMFEGEMVFVVHKG